MVRNVQRPMEEEVETATFCWRLLDDHGSLSVRSSQLLLAGTMLATRVTRRWSSAMVSHGQFVCAFCGGLYGGVQWQNGHVFIIDNTLVMHSRDTYVPPGRAHASLCEPPNYSARAFGICASMSGREARARCPHLEVISETSKRVN